MTTDDVTGRERIRWIDLSERVLGAVLYSHLFLRIVVFNTTPLTVPDGLLLASEGLVLFFLLIRRRSNRVSLRFDEWLVAMIATVAPLAVWPSQGTPLLPLAVCGVIALGGFALHVAAKLTLRRSFGLVPANRGVRGVGPYRWVRHPMYAGYMITYVGYLLANPIAWNLAVYVVAVAAQLFRIAREERLLSQDDEYRRLMTRTPYRLVPLVY